MKVNRLKELRCPFQNIRLPEKYTILFKRCSSVTSLVAIHLFYLSVAAEAQENKPVATTSKEIQIGQKVPEIFFTNVFNYKDSTIRLSGLKGKAVILDFWATWCSGCVKGIPHMDSLQRMYPEKLQVLMIDAFGRDSREKLLSFLKKKKEEIPGFCLPVIQGNDIKSIFPHMFLPHYVWISPDGIVQAITGQQALSPINIKNFISGKTLNLPVKQQ